LKHEHRDPRAVLERASARETATRVGCAAIARQVLERFDIEVFAHVVELGGIAVDPDVVERAFGPGLGPNSGSARERETRHALRDASEFYALDPAVDAKLKALVDRA